MTLVSNHGSKSLHRFAGVALILSDAVSDFTQRIRQRRKQRRDRLAFQQLLRLDDVALRDIGYTRSDVEDANQLPLEMNAAIAVYEARMMRTREQHDWRHRKHQ